MDAMSWREETSELDPTELGWRWFVRWKVEVRVVRNVRGNKARRAPRTGGGSKITLYIHSNTSLPTEAGRSEAGLFSGRLGAGAGTDVGKSSSMLVSPPMSMSLDGLRSWRT
jgi:hypothetical protein